jgi:hypothetical protein
MDLEGVKAGITDVQKAVGELEAPGLADRPEEASEVGRHTSVFVYDSTVLFARENEPQPF